MLQKILIEESQKKIKKECKVKNSLNNKFFQIIINQKN